MNKKSEEIDEAILNIEERKVADQVANEILQKEKEEKRRIIFFLLLFILLVFTLSYLIFSRFALFSKNLDNTIQSGSVVFSYEEGRNQINIIDAVSTRDEIGKNLSEEDNYFEFYVAVKVNSNIQKKITYEISLTPGKSTLEDKYVRVYLLKNNKEVLINNKGVNKFSELKNSNIRKDAKLLYKTTVTTESKDYYVFKMWVGEDYMLDAVSRIFTCYVNIDAY